MKGLRKNPKLGDFMTRQSLSILLAWILGIQSGLIAKAEALVRGAPTQTERSQAPTLRVREKVLEIPPQTMVEVRLRNKEKLRGRLEETSDQGFVLKVATQNKIEDRKVAFDEVKSIKKLEGGKAGKTAGMVTLGILAGIGVAFLTLLAIYAHAE